MIKIRNIYRTFGQKQVLKGATLTVNKGENYLLIGRSGAGKTVLLKNILGLLRPDSGTIAIDGVDITQLAKKKLEKVRLQFGLVFQGSALFDFLTIEENVGFFFYQHTKLKKFEIRKKVTETLALVGLEGIEDMYPYELSGGMRKRVGLARSLSLGPKIMLYDEPTTGLDPITTKMVNDLIILTQKEYSNRGMTSVIISHDVKASLMISDFIAFLDRGRIVEYLPASEFANSSNSLVQEFINL